MLTREHKIRLQKLFWIQGAMALNGRCFTPSLSLWSIFLAHGRSRKLTPETQCCSSTLHNACKDAPKPIGWSLWLNTQMVAALKLLLSGKNAVITRSDFKSEAIFGFLSPNYTWRSAWFFSWNLKTGSIWDQIDVLASRTLITSVNLLRLYFFPKKFE